jgi:hypothetical protein
VLKNCFGKTILFHILSDKKNEVDNFDQRVVSDIFDFCDSIKQILVGTDYFLNLNNIPFSLD